MRDEEWALRTPDEVADLVSREGFRTHTTTGRTPPGEYERLADRIAQAEEDLRLVERETARLAASNASMAAWRVGVEAAEGERKRLNSRWAGYLAALVIGFLGYLMPRLAEWAEFVEHRAPRTQSAPGAQWGAPSSQQAPLQ